MSGSKSPLKEGDMVYYPAHGMGVVRDRKEETILGETFLITKAYFANSRVTITLRENQIHRLFRPEEFATKEKVAHIPLLLRGKSSRKKSRAWKTEFDAVKRRVCSDDFLDLIQGIRDLAQRQVLPVGNKRSADEVHLLRDAMRRLRGLLDAAVPDKAQDILAEANAIFTKKGFLPLSKY